MELRAGDIVYSKAGRDKGKYFVVVFIESDEYVLICDGKRRKVDKPKRKKRKHLTETGKTATLIGEKLAAGEAVTNPLVRRALCQMDENV
ncbi:MAG: KOW domain-containing RNA-binding protein [Clostridia bacterium]|nr:KOW domain-containing RNA-binding protein [Clostridia bacterium]